MAHYAFIDENNLVIDVIVGRDESDLAEGVGSWEEYYGTIRGMRCLRTSFNTHRNTHQDGGTPFRGNYAGIGFSYDEALDAFIPYQPFVSWIFDAKLFDWKPPKTKPKKTDLKDYVWDEATLDWLVIDLMPASVASVEVEDEAV